jgi:hypothetical protein
MLGYHTYRQAVDSHFLRTFVQIDITLYVSSLGFFKQHSKIGRWTSVRGQTGS